MEHIQFLGQFVETGVLIGIFYKLGKFEEFGKNLDKRLTALEELFNNFIKRKKRRRK